MGFVNLKKRLRKELKSEMCYASSVRKAEEVVITVLVKKIKMHDYMPKIKRDSIVQKNLQPRDVILNSEKNINFNVNIENISLVLR